MRSRTPPRSSGSASLAVIHSCTKTKHLCQTAYSLASIDRPRNAECAKWRCRKVLAFEPAHCDLCVMTDASENQTVEAKATVAAVIVAAGRGERAGQADGPKQYRKIGGRSRHRPHAGHFSGASAHRPGRRRHPSRRRRPFRACGRRPSPSVCVVVMAAPRGRNRCWLGLQALTSHAPDQVLIHDAVRPFVDAALDRPHHCRDRRTAWRAAGPARRRHAEARSGRRHWIGGHRRQGTACYAAQTPQGFPFWPILAAHEKAHHAGQDGFHRRCRDRRMGADAGQARHRLAGQYQTHLGTGYRHGRPTAFRRTARAFPMSAPAMATTSILRAGRPCDPVRRRHSASTRSCPAIPTPMSACMR